MGDDCSERQATAFLRDRKGVLCKIGDEGSRDGGDEVTQRLWAREALTVAVSLMVSELSVSITPARRWSPFSLG